MYSKSVNARWRRSLVKESWVRILFSLLLQKYCASYFIMNHHAAIVFFFIYSLSHKHTHTWKDSHDGRLLAGPKGLVPKVPKSLVHLRRNFCRRDSIILSTFNSTRHTVHQMLFICFSAWWDRWIYPALCRPLVDCTAAPWVEEEQDARSRVS